MLKRSSFSKEEYNDILNIAKYCKCSFVGVFYRALGLLKLVTRTQKEGGKVIIKEGNGNLRQVLDIRSLDESEYIL